ncbi:hypothetical protein ZWY2020_047303 [Hordeum vulgare]|nr:hypothetical protein ZWY2020_047303 [Hordeum vulgare]
MPPRHPMPSMDATTAMAQGRTKGWSSRLGTAVRMLAPVRAVMAWWQKKVVFPRSRVLAGVSIRGLARKTGIISSGQAATNDARSQCRRSVAVGLEMRMPPHSAAPMALVGSFITQVNSGELFWTNEVCGVNKYGTNCVDLQRTSSVLQFYGGSVSPEISTPKAT